MLSDSDLKGVLANILKISVSRLAPDLDQVTWKSIMCIYFISDVTHCTKYGNDQAVVQSILSEQHMRWPVALIMLLKIKMGHLVSRGSLCINFNFQAKWT